MPQADDSGLGSTLLKDRRSGWSSWRSLAQKTPLKLEAPTAWASGSEWAQFRAYTIRTTEGRRVAAAVAVAETPQYGFWTVQALRWTDPPAVKDPTVTTTIGGRTYLLFYRGADLHMVAWREDGTLYWLTNTLDDQLPNEVVLGLAKSCRPVG